MQLNRLHTINITSLRHPSFSAHQKPMEHQLIREACLPCRKSNGNGVSQNYGYFSQGPTDVKVYWGILGSHSERLHVKSR